MLVPMRTATSTRQTIPTLPPAAATGDAETHRAHVAQPHELGHRVAAVDEHQAALDFDLAPAAGPKLYGYARVSTKAQDLGGQVAQLRAAGVAASDIRTEKGSGAGRRPVLDQLVAGLQAGDVLVVTELSRLGRVGRSLIELVDDLNSRGVGIRALAHGIDTTDPIAGRILVYVFAALAQTERELTIERTRTGLAAARAAGHRGGRPAVMTPERLRVARELTASGATIAEAARTIGVSRPTLSRHLNSGTAAA